MRPPPPTGLRTARQATIAEPASKPVGDLKPSGFFVEHRDYRGRSPDVGGVSVAETGGMDTTYPLSFSVDYPDRPLSRLTSFFRPVLAIPIAVVLGAVGAGVGTAGWDNGATIVAGGGLLIAGPLLMIVFRRKYPRWWFDWNRELLRFSNRVGVYLALMDDRYPSTDEEQQVHLEVEYPDVEHDLNRWMPLVKWFLAIPHYLVLVFLWIGAILAVLAAWVAIVFTGRYPRALFDYVEGVLRWQNRLVAYLGMLVTDRYPPFRLAG